MRVAFSGLLLLDLDGAAAAFTGFFACSFFYFTTVTLLYGFWLLVKPSVFDLVMGSFFVTGFYLEGF